MPSPAKPDDRTTDGVQSPVRSFVTGGSGFVGTRLNAYLSRLGHEVVSPGPEIDITSPEQIAAAINDVHPHLVFHLAGQANVGSSWTEARLTYQVNFDGTRHVLDAARQVDPMPRVLVVSSADVYGPAAFNLHGGGVDEDSAARPVSPYGASKLAAEVVARQAFDGFGLPVVISRAFPHIGPGQSDGFVVGAIARQIAEAERDGGEEIALGNLEAERDFLDVDDVVRAYHLAVLFGRSGATYNVASGTATPIRDVIDHMVSLSTRSLRIVVDPARLRPIDVPRMIGDSSRLTADTGWKPESNWRVAAAAALGSWRTKVLTDSA